MPDRNGQHLSEEALDPLFTPEVTQQILGFRFSDATERRLDELRERANAGTLKDDEREEYERFADTIDMLAELRSRAVEASNRRAS